jgi:predicted DNA-binding transcriptional regulator AlpA
MAQQDELVGVTEIAALFGVAQNTAWRWSRDEGFPDPTARLASGPIWQRADVERWHRERVPRPTGRPRKTQ